mgnify:CR=1 FL=1
MAGHVLEVQNVTKRYGSAKRGDELATLGLAGVSFFGFGQIHAFELHIHDRCGHERLHSRGGT